MLQYQNCAPTPQAVDSAGESYADVIDQVNVGEISFPQTKVAAFMDESVTVAGLCAQSGSFISWKLTDVKGDVIERGLAECELGSFQVTLGDQWQGYCDQDLNLKAALGAKSSSEAIIQAYCE